MLFSEPKIPQLNVALDVQSAPYPFQCSSASRKFLNAALDVRRLVLLQQVSVLFSEPKIPQSSSISATAGDCGSFSALQRAENSSIRRRAAAQTARRGFSALQRAENSSIGAVGLFQVLQNRLFQCSSASRKFLNSRRYPYTSQVPSVSVLFSEPKIPQSTSIIRCLRTANVSVLFSEPKIPQFKRMVGKLTDEARFQCSSASRKFLNQVDVTTSAACDQRFQCSSASRKFLNTTMPTATRCSRPFQCSSASRKFLNSELLKQYPALRESFSALQRAENSSIPQHRCHPIRQRNVSVLFSEPKIPQFSAVESGPALIPRFSALQRAENSSIDL